MYIEEISVVNYKNIKDVKVEFSPKLNCFIGNNGAGKTNMLDAVYYLSFCKSFFNSVDHLNVNHEEIFFMLSGNYKRLDSYETISCVLQKGQKKQFKRNSKVYKKLADHIGLLPLVMITPSDVNLILGGSDERRKFIDGVISQYNQNYLDDLLKYNRALLQRNNLLKQFSLERYFDVELLAIWDNQLIEYGNRIHKFREEFVKKLIPKFQHYYSFISQVNEMVGLIHQSDLYKNNFDELLKNSIAKDRAVQHTTVGIHKDDLVLNIGDYPIKKLGSQGQKKTFLAALKLAQFDFIKEISGLKPVLLLDDIFDKLDHHRVEQIIKIVSDQQFGQIFITDTNRQHLNTIIENMNTDFRIFNVNSGTVELVK
ncbi:MAG: DNA replication/repair protein RecF [Prolixibacteraceae bacterium]|jgi:DNA replication and repair protein RecF|nr:DNA replication/repair protein RecF [Prolixibacteraceae bacterium]MBT6005609.1 DNA replication/repair protein RecF [Prolixibacteraceae bacterium]MBT6766424.1 DNA replication/repair protein RecF [Prolixibacteraceae bacterium]MBT7000953.1 DNA replication/repair protein RecF [Prolixibacteraceae bacterium]MBT7397302.1 DNA replication/repair protein RecF [Prolixibacteraceae bacterium]